MRSLIRSTLTSVPLAPLLLIVAFTMLSPALERQAHAQDTAAETLPQYQVEMIVVRHTDPAYGTELFPYDAPPTGDDELDAQRFIPLGANELSMTDIAARLARSSRYEVISHAGWTQPGFAREDAKRKIILRTNANGDQLSGSAVMSRERYLRLVLDLTVTLNGERYFMNTGRRMISRQTHYFDHPHFGVIAKITPL